MPYTTYEPPPTISPYDKMLTEYAEATERARARRKILLERIAALQMQENPPDTAGLRQRADLLLTEIYEMRAAMKAIREYAESF